VTGKDIVDGAGTGPGRGHAGRIRQAEVVGDCPGVSGDDRRGVGQAERVVERLADVDLLRGTRIGQTEGVIDRAGKPAG